jgi:predicted O-methyltransferase YrrM
MQFKTLPVARDIRFQMKTGRFLRGARKRQPNLPWNEFLRIARHFKVDDMGSYPERGFLFELSHRLPENARAVEIGSWMGCSTCFLASGLRGPESRLYAVDNFRGLSTCAKDSTCYQGHFQSLGTSGTRTIFDRNLSTLGFEKRVEAIEMDSLAAAAAFPLPKGSLDLVFIDGDHALEACRADLNAWKPYLKTGGIMAFHDFGGREGVTEAIFDAIKAGTFARIIGVAGTIIAFEV